MDAKQQVREGRRVFRFPSFSLGALPMIPDGRNLASHLVLLVAKGMGDTYNTTTMEDAKLVTLRYATLRYGGVATDDGSPWIN
jgi:hypothetical protein